MTELSPKARELLDIGRNAITPDDATRARVHDALQARIAASPPASSANGTSVLASTAARFAISGLLITALVVGGALLWPDEHQTRSPRVEGAPASISPSMEPTLKHARTTRSTLRSDTKSGAGTTVTNGSEPSGARVAQTRANAPRAAEAPARKKPLTRPRRSEADTRKQPVRTSLAEELRLLRAARTAVRKGRGTTALMLLDQYAERFPSGVLRQEAAGVRVDALCALGNSAQARIAAKRFLATWPDSPMLDRMRSACASE